MIDPLKVLTIAIPLAFATAFAANAGFLDNIGRDVNRTTTSIGKSLEDVGKSIENSTQNVGKEIGRPNLPETEQSPSDPCSVNAKLPQCQQLGAEPK